MSTRPESPHIIGVHASWDLPEQECSGWKGRAERVCCMDERRWQELYNKNGEFIINLCSNFYVQVILRSWSQLSAEL